MRKIKQQPTVCILPGFSEGQHTVKVLSQTLQVRGFRMLNKPEHADIILAHSGGCFLIPSNSQAQLVVLIGVPYWPNKRLARAIIEKLRISWQLTSQATWLRKFGLHALYVWNVPHNFAMWQGRRGGAVWKLTVPVLLIRNQQDTYCTADIASLPFTSNPDSLQLPGDHDACWDHPKQYANIVHSYYERLLAQANDRQTAIQ